MSNKLSSLRLLESYLEDLGSFIEESNRLFELEVSSKDNDYELRKSLSKIKKFLERNDDGHDYDELVETYKNYLKDVKTIDVADFEYERKVAPKTLTTKKSVRFNETVEFSSPETMKSYKPYRDQVISEPDPSETEQLFDGVGAVNGVEDTDSDSQSIDSASNQELFIQHQQQLLEQDSHLDTLAGSVSRQREISMEINNELSDQNILLDDLEGQLDTSDRNLRSGQKRLDFFSKKAKENGHWITIIVLTIILIFLLVVLN